MSMMSLMTFIIRLPRAIISDNFIGNSPLPYISRETATTKGYDNTYKATHQDKKYTLQLTDLGFRVYYTYKIYYHQEDSLLSRKNLSYKLVALLLSVSIFFTVDTVSYATGTGTGTGTSTTTGTTTGTTGGTTSGTTGGTSSAATTGASDSTGTGTNKDVGGGGTTTDGYSSVTPGLTVDPVTNDITYTTIDRQHTPGTSYYHTFGFTISEVAYDSSGNPYNTGKTVTVYLDDATGIATNVGVWNADTAGKVTTSSWTIDYNLLTEYISTQYPEWGASIKNGTSVGYEMNAIVSVWDAAIGYYIGQYDSTYGAIGELFDYTNYSELVARYPWMEKYIDNHFNKLLLKKKATGLIDDGSEKDSSADASNPPYKIKDIIGKQDPDFWTFNWNPKGQFDLGDAIPTSEDVRNGYQADQFFGQATVGTKEGAYHAWNYGGTITWTESYKYTYTDYENPNPDGSYNEVEDTVEYTVGKSYSYVVEREVGYWYLGSAAFYDLDTVKDENTVYPSGAHNFTSKIDVPMSCTINGTDLTLTGSYDSVPNDDYHVNWAGAVLINDFEINASGKTQAQAEAAFKAEAESRIKTNDLIEVRNDLLEINGITYMTSEFHQFKNWQNAMKKGDRYAYSDIGDYGIDRQDTGETGDNERIPSTIKNKAYTTTITVNYKQKISPGSSTSRSKSGVGAILSEAVPTGIGKDFPSQEPIKVHTPVVSPVIILDSDTGNRLNINSVAEYKKTQLVDGSIEGFGDAYNEDADYQLLLDGSYTIKFDISKHFEHLGYESAASNDGLSTEIYNKYTKRRYVCFPFIVQVDGKVYYPDDEETEATDDAPGKEAGYTEWIEVYRDDADGHDEDTVDFYVPTWAIEGYSYTLQYMVVPENATKEDFDYYRQEGLKNVSAPIIAGDGHLYNYMATYTMEVQLSGIIYDFQVVGINERDVYNGYKKTANGNEVGSGIADTTQDFAFCPTKQEKKQGNKNRIGGNYVRYTFDGSLTTDWKDANTLPLSAGSSLAYKKAGVLRKGDQFAFTIRTIANLWDEEGDEIYIVPSFRYVSFDGGTVKDDINVYYTKVTDSDVMEFVKYGSTQDLSSFKETSIDNEKFRGSFYHEDLSLDRTLHAFQEDDAEFSKDIANELLYALKYPGNHQWPKEVYANTQIYLHKPAECCTLSSIKLTHDLRLLTGNLEQLEQNLEYEGASALTYVKTKDENGVSYDITKSSEPETWEAFRKSMQTWFGTYFIPYTLYVTDGDVDVWDYASEHGYIRGDEDIFYDEGYLVVNFDIYTKNNGEWHLKYYGTDDGKNQWDVQGGKTSANVGDPTVGREITIPLRPGDVAIIDMSQSKKDDYTVGQYINN